MDREVLKLMAPIDQTRADVRTALERAEPDDLVELFRDCASGRAPVDYRRNGRPPATQGLVQVKPGSATNRKKRNAD